MTKEKDEAQEQSKTAHIQDHLNQLLAEEDRLTEEHDSQSKKNTAIVHTDSAEKLSWRERLVKTLRTFYSDDGEPLHVATPAELKEMDDSTKSKRQFSIPVLDTMEQQGMMTIAGLLVVAGLLGFLVSPWGSVSTYKVKGNQEVPTAQLLDKLELDKGQSSLLLLTEERALAKKAHQFDPQIQNVKFTLKSPTVLEVKVTEIPSVGYIKEKDMYVPLLADGTRLTEDAKKWPAENFPVYSGFKSDEQLDNVLESFGTLSLALRQAVSEVIWSPTSENSSRLIFVMNDGNQVFANAENFEKKFKYYPGMATQLKKNGVIDLQVGAYAKPY
jgi:cell division protein FtsQ